MSHKLEGHWLKAFIVTEVMLDEGCVCNFFPSVWAG
jgi:hypothetical protein